MPARVYSFQMSSLLETVAERDTKHTTSAIHAGVPRGVKAKSDTSLSPTGNSAFGDQSPVVTAQVGALHSWETLTKRPFEHWLNISQSYKKQHGDYKRGSLNQILYTAGTFRFFFPCCLVDFSPLSPCRLTAGFGLQRHQ